MTPSNDIRTSFMSRQNTWLVSAAGISSKITQAPVQPYLGPDASCDESGRVDGFFRVTAYRSSTTAMIRELKAGPRRWRADQAEKARRTEKAPPDMNIVLALEHSPSETAEACRSLASWHGKVPEDHLASNRTARNRRRTTGKRIHRCGRTHCPIWLSDRGTKKYIHFALASTSDARPKDERERSGHCDKSDPSAHCQDHRTLLRRGKRPE
jgi:hypothetical protein